MPDRRQFLHALATSSLLATGVAGRAQAQRIGAALRARNVRTVLWITQMLNEGSFDAEVGGDVVQGALGVVEGGDELAVAGGEVGGHACSVTPRGAVWKSESAHRHECARKRGRCAPRGAGGVTGRCQGTDPKTGSTTETPRAPRKVEIPPQRHGVTEGTQRKAGTRRKTVHHEDTKARRETFTTEHTEGTERESETRQGRDPQREGRALARAPEHAGDSGKSAKGGSRAERARGKTGG